MVFVIKLKHTETKIAVVREGEGTGQSSRAKQYCFDYYYLFCIKMNNKMCDSYARAHAKLCKTVINYVLTTLSSKQSNNEKKSTKQMFIVSAPMLNVPYIHFKMYTQPYIHWHIFAFFIVFVHISVCFSTVHFYILLAVDK